jgi:hypothetical protein
MALVFESYSIKVYAGGGGGGYDGNLGVNGDQL